LGLCSWGVPGTYLIHPCHGTRPWRHCRHTWASQWTSFSGAVLCASCALVLHAEIGHDWNKWWTHGNPICLVIEYSIAEKVGWCGNLLEQICDSDFKMLTQEL
jgi:hypothetical protein